MQKNNNKNLNVRLSADLYAALKKAAIKDQRTLSSLVKKILTEGAMHLEELEKKAKKIF